MSALVHISGRLHGEPVTRPTRNGGEWTAFKMKVASGNRVEFWSVATFSDTAREELAGLNEGDALSAVGELHVEQYAWKGETRIALKVSADRILALKPKPKAKTRRALDGSDRLSGRDIASASWAAPAIGSGDASDSPF